MSDLLPDPGPATVTSRREPYYEADGIILWHGDCREITDWLTADILVTDPPYGMSYSARSTYDPRNGRTYEAEIENVVGDETLAARDECLTAWGSRPAIVFGTWRQPRPAATLHRLIWWKQGSPPGPAKAAFMLQDEEIYVLGKGFRATSPPLRSVLATSETRQGSAGAVATIGHPTPKPVGLMQTLIDRCPPGTIADPFAGSGSTLIAAKMLDRKAIGVEIEERYCEIAARRLDQGVLNFGGAA